MRLSVDAQVYRLRSRSKSHACPFSFYPTATPLTLHVSSNTDDYHDPNGPYSQSFSFGECHCAFPILTFCRVYASMVPSLRTQQPYVSDIFICSISQTEVPHGVSVKSSSSALCDSTDLLSESPRTVAGLNNGLSTTTLSSGVSIRTFPHA